MTHHVADLEARFEKLDRDRSALDEGLNLLVEANRELTETLCDAIEAPQVRDRARAAAKRQVTRLGNCVERFEILLREQHDAVQAVHATLQDVRRALS